MGKAQDFATSQLALPSHSAEIWGFFIFYSCPHLPTWLVTVTGITTGRLYTPNSPDSEFLLLQFTSFLAPQPFGAGIIFF